MLKYKELNRPKKAGFHINIILFLIKYHNSNIAMLNKKLRLLSLLKTNAVASFLSGALTISTLLFITQQSKKFIALRFIKNETIVLTLIALLIGISITLSFRNGRAGKSIASFLTMNAVPVSLLLIVFYFSDHSFPLWTKIYTDAYILLASFYFLFKYKKYSRLSDFIKDFDFRNEQHITTKFKKISIFAIILLVMIVNLGYGMHHLSKFAAVDEPLWTYGRIPKFWNNIKDGELEKTAVSDKPGITVAIISGAGLLKLDPKEYEPDRFQGEVIAGEKNIEEMNFAFRFPILLFTVFSLPIFYFFLKRLLGWLAAIVSVIFIGTSPILLGISTIINPDALLWIFAPLSMVAFLDYLKKNSTSSLYWSSFFLGLALLTKYVSNILFVYYFLLIFIHPALENTSRNNFSLQIYLKRMLADYLVLIFIALLTFFIFLPAAWLNIYQIFEGTIFSKAFLKTWPLFVGTLTLVSLDVFLLKSKVISWILNQVRNHKKVLIASICTTFFILIVLTLANVYSGMTWFNFEEIISSPKTSFVSNGVIGLMLANIYSLIFGMSPISFLALLLFLAWAVIKRKNESNNLLWGSYIAFFILLYYLASTINLVSATTRYQIIIFPLAFILSSLAMEVVVNSVQKKFVFVIALSFIFITSLFSLNSIKPFYFSYASDLLPKQYVLNFKDMGDGSYEAAEYLNSLSNAENLTIWTDKRGVCNFFVGYCHSGFDFDKRGISFDYFVVSAGRENRTTRLTLSRVNGGNSQLIRLDRLYDFENPVYKIEIGGRPNNFVKIVSSKDLGL